MFVLMKEAREARHGDASVELSLQAAPKVVKTASTVSKHATDIGHALELAMAQFPAGGKKRVVLLNDGNETQGNAQETALVAQSLGIEVWSVPIRSMQRPMDVQLDRVMAPARVDVSEPHEVRVVVSGQQAASAHLLLFCDQTLMGERKVKLRPGKTAVVFPDTLEEPGLHRYEAVVNRVGDPITENNRGLAFTEVAGKAKILIVYGEEGPPTELAQTLTVQGLAPELRRWTGLPSSLSELLKYDAVILEDAPELGCRRAKWRLLRNTCGTAAA
jgi:Ca-activated chloride channel homolog